MLHLRCGKGILRRPFPGFVPSPGILLTSEIQNENLEVCRTSLHKHLLTI